MMYSLSHFKDLKNVLLFKQFWKVSKTLMQTTFELLRAIHFKKINVNYFSFYVNILKDKYLLIETYFNIGQLTYQFKTQRIFLWEWPLQIYFNQLVQDPFTLNQPIYKRYEIYLENWFDFDWSLLWSTYFHNKSFLYNNMLQSLQK